jgi:diketogulonate reductase-like aldo/keto reductase
MQKPWIVPIPGPRKRERLEENLGVVAIELTADDLRRLRARPPQSRCTGRGTLNTCRNWSGAERQKICSLVAFRFAVGEF